MPRVFVPAVLSAVLLWAAFFPLDLGFLGFVALVPWLSLVRAPVSRRRRYLAAYLGGAAFFGLATNWVRVAHPMMYLSWLGLTVVMPVTWVIALDLVRRLDRLGLPLAVSVPAAWVALEYARMHFPTGFPPLRALDLQHMIGFGWYFLGYTQHAYLPLIQVADLGGVYAVSFLVAAVNGVVADWAYRAPAVRGWLRWEEAAPPTPRVRPVVAATAGVAVLVAGSAGYGFAQLARANFAPGPRVAAIQGSTPQGEKMAKADSLVEAYAALHLAAATADPPPDLVVWPETCFPEDWFEVAPGQAPSGAFARQVDAGERYFRRFWFRAPTLLGLNAVEWDGDRAWKYNSALLVTPKAERVARYDKMHLVPFGEYVPLGNVFPFMSTFTPYKHDYACRPGRSWTRFPVAGNGRTFTFGCLICYEDSDPSLAREYVRTDPVDFLVNISNDGWFDGTEEHEQHLAICRFRAVEARRSVVRAVNMGISGVVDPNGAVVVLPGPTWAGSKKMTGVVSAVVPVDSRPSWYAAVGDWVPGACWAVVLVGLVAGRFRG
ncbi:MAG: apolipoprotein N-acyltransferase [Isosphaera sp.]|nr:apolipoprotein N-acyltransferase [Isosphaera sp.]